MATPVPDLLTVDLDNAYKTTLIQLCRLHGVPHGGLKSLLVTRLHALRATLTAPAPATSAVAGPSTTTASTSASLVAPSTAPPPTVAPTSLQFHAASPAPHGLLAHTQIPGPSAVGSASQAQTSFAYTAPLSYLPPPFSLSTQLLPQTTTQAVASGSTTTQQHLAAIQAAQQAYFAALQPLAPTQQPPPDGHPTLPPSLHSSHMSNTLPQPTLPTTSTTVPTWLYQPPTATAQQVLNLQALTPAALPGAAPSLHSTIPHLAPLNGSIPAIPARFASAAAAGEFVDFNELLHALESDSGEEPPIYVQVGEGQQLSLPRKPKKRVITAFHEWARCFCVYSHHLAAHQPLRGPDLLAYLYLIATCHTEYTFPACLAYDVAFRKKAGRFRLASWGNIDPQLYAKAFTGSGKARPRAWCDSCLTAQHSTADCPLFYPGGPAKKARATPAGPRHSSRPNIASEICRNFNRGRCHSPNCPRKHVCLSCGGSHQSVQCPTRRSSPRKQ